MKTNLLTLALMSALAVAPACGTDDTGGSDDTGAAASVPSAEMLSLAVDSSSNGAALTEETSLTDAIAQELVGQLDDAVALLQARIEALKASATSTQETQGAVTCTVWKAQNETIDYKLAVCERERRATHYDILLAGRPVGSTSDDAYVTLAAGHGTALPRFDGERRGTGVIGYDFDAWHTLRGSGPVGSVALGYRNAGRARTINAAYRNFASNDTAEKHSARLTYHRVFGVGGRIVFGVGADVIAPGDTAGTYVIGQDDLSERVRLALVWAKGLGARVSGTACGGTVGDACIHVAQCYKFDTEVTFEDVRQNNQAAFDEVACPSVQFPVSEPSEGDVAVGSDSDSDVPGPDVDEPAQSADE